MSKELVQKLADDLGAKVKFLPAPPEATKAGRRVFITDENSVIVSELQPITRERTEEVGEFISRYCRVNNNWTSAGYGRAVFAWLELQGLPMADEK